MWHVKVLEVNDVSEVNVCASVLFLCTDILATYRHKTMK